MMFNTEYLRTAKNTYECLLLIYHITDLKLAFSKEKFS